MCGRYLRRSGKQRIAEAFKVGHLPEDFVLPPDTNTFNNDPFYSNGATARFAETTNDTGEVVSVAVRLGERLWREGFRYSKTGVMITELLPENIRQPALWASCTANVFMFWGSRQKTDNRAR